MIAEHTHWFEPLADHMGSAYLRYSFTMGTEQEVDFLVAELGLSHGCRVLDVGCGPGRHSLSLARRGIEVVGVDISERFVDVASSANQPGATFRRIDARHLDYENEFDAAISLCQGAFGLVCGPGMPLDGDGEVLAGMARAVRPGGQIAVSAFSAYFQVRFPGDNATFHAGSGVNEELTSVLDGNKQPLPATLWTTCFTPRELRLLAERASLHVRGLWSVAPGAYTRREPDLDHPEFLLVAGVRASRRG